MDSDDNSEQFWPINAYAIDFSEAYSLLDESMDSLQFWAEKHHCSPIEQPEPTSCKRFNSN
jgi:hypothetical protein